MNARGLSFFMQRNNLILILECLLMVFQPTSALWGDRVDESMFSNDDPLADAKLGQDWFGPLTYHQSSDAGTRWGWPGVFSYQSFKPIDSVEWDFLYPVLRYDRFGDESRLNFMSFFTIDRGDHATGGPRTRSAFFPFYFSDRGAEPSLNRKALWPVYGHMRRHFLRDEISFFLWPLYVRTEKKDVTTYNFLTPLIHWRKGHQLEGWQFLPFGSWERRKSHVMPNADGSQTFVPGYLKKSVAWPFFQTQQSELQNGDTMTRTALIPFYSLEKAPDRFSLTLPWPVGVTRKVDHQKDYREWGIPWPIITWARGDDKRAIRIWPLFGSQNSPNQQKGFVAWPLLRFQNKRNTASVKNSQQILFHLYKHVEETQRSNNEVLRERWSLWPFFIKERKNETTSIQWLAPLEAILWDKETLQRHYSPFWAIWRSQKDEVSGRHVRSFLWNVWRSDRSPKGNESSLLFGLFKHKESSSKSHWYVFGRPIGPSRNTP